MAEVAHAGHDHGDAGRVGGVDDVLILDRAAGLDDGGGPRLDRGEHAVGEGEEGIRGDDRALGERAVETRGSGRVDRLAVGDAGGIEPAHLARADADGGAVLHIDDGVRLDVLGDLHGDPEVGEFGLGRRLFGHDLELGIIDIAVVAALDQQSTGHGFHREAFGTAIGEAAGEQEAEVLLGGDDADGLVGRLGRDDHLGEDLDDLGRGVGVEQAIERDDAAEGADRIGAQRQLIGFEQRLADGEATGVGVLDDGDGRRCGVEFRDQLESGVGIVEIVVAERLALHLAGGGNAGALFARGVEGGPLVGVLAVAHDLAQLTGEAAPGQLGVIERVGEPA